MARSDEIELRDEDRLPWLETVEPDEPESSGLGRLIAVAVIGLLVLAGLAAALFHFGGGRGSDGNGQLIAAPQGDYKLRPDDPGGLKVEGEGEAAIATSAGSDGSGGRIDLKAVPEAPVAARRGEPLVPPTETQGDARAVSAVPQSGGRLAAAPPMRAPRAPVPGAASGGTLVQLGAFPTAGAANGAWSAIAKRFAYVSTLAKSVQMAEVGGRTVYRLRIDAGSAGAASDICGRLKVAGESCFVTS